MNLTANKDRIDEDLKIIRIDNKGYKIKINNIEDITNRLLINKIVNEINCLNILNVDINEQINILIENIIKPINISNIKESSSRLKVIKCDIIYPSPAEYIDIEPEFIWLSSIEDSMAQFNVYSNTDWIVE